MVKRSLSLWVFFLLVQFLPAQKPLSALPKMSAPPLREDVLLLKKILEANHPSLYWYTPKDSIDAYFRYTINSITDSLNEVDFKNRVAWLVSRIRCGHTTVRFSQAYGKIAAGYRYPLFPLALKAWDDSLVVLSSLRPQDSVFKRGTRILSIDGRSSRAILDTLCQFISSDGYSEGYQKQVISSNFPAWYKTILGVDSIYTITYLDSLGKETTAGIKGFNPLKDTTKPTRETSLPKIPRKLRLLGKRALYIDTANSTAWMRLTTFTGGRLKRFFRKSFKTLQHQQIRHLVIDLRENGGGNVSNSIQLTRYLAQRPFRLGDSVVALSRQFQYSRYIKPVLPYWLAMHLVARKMNDGHIHFRHYELHNYTPMQKNHFNGDLYLMQGGLTFSAATMAIATLKGQQNVTIVGEETGGGFYGNSAMHIPTIRLPYSGLQVSLPLYRLVIDSTHPRGRGIMPDLEIKPSSAAIRQGRDLKAETIRTLIQRKNQ